VLTEVRVHRAAARLTDRWRRVPVAPRGDTRLGVTFRPLQARDLGLDPGEALRLLLDYPFEVIRIAAYWDRLEPARGEFLTGELDRVLDAAEQAGKQIILGVGAVKNFGYPEFFVPEHELDRPLPEGALITPGEHGRLLDAATGVITRVVERYRDRAGIVAWQVEHEAVDPLGMEHSWRLAEAFAAAEVAAVRAADPGRPVLMNGFLPTSTPVALQQRWRTRDQGDSLAVAVRLADMVGLDIYPRHALAAGGPVAVYLDGTGTRGYRRRLGRVLSNLLDNAIKYSPDGGTIRVHVGLEAETWAVLAVEDEGIGIPQDELERVFGRFQRGTNVIGQIVGSGIGLASARQIVENHGGVLTA